MKSLITFMTFFLFNSSFAQLITNVTWTEKDAKATPELIYYDTDADLEWENFSGTPVNRGNVAAITVSGFGYKADINTINGKGHLNIQVFCFFNKNKSWVKPGKKTPYILTHEQHHFDISYISACIFINKLKEAFFTKNNFNVLLSRIYNESCDIMNRMQDDYDGQTKNGQSKDVQAKWNDFLDDKISSL